VIATVRDPAEASELRGISGEVRIEQLEMADHAALARFPERLGGQPIDLLICNAGMSGPRAGPGNWSRRAG
jgi:NAD(P)-dependent dehydrogenase (short-subunit alcohol dehydrogenase family)